MLRRKKTGQSIMEYIAVLIIVMAALLAFQKYIKYAFNARWKGVGDSMGYGRLYNPGNTFECAFDFQYTNFWYKTDYFEGHCIADCFGSEADTKDNLPGMSRCHQCYVTAVTIGSIVNGVNVCNQ